MSQLALATAIVLFCWFVGVGLLGISSRLDKTIPKGLAPVLGAAVWMLVAQFARLFPGGSLPLIMTVIAIAVGAAVILVRLARLGRLAELLQGTLPALFATLIVALLFVFPWIVEPSLAGVLHFTNNHDASHFSSGAQWLLDHSSFDVPSVTAEPTPDSAGPAYLPAMKTLTFPLRNGFETLFASVLAVTKLSAYSAWPAVIAAFSSLIAAAGTSFAQAAKSGRLLGALAGILIALSPMAIFQLANQNGASLAGIAFALTVLLLWWQVLGSPDRTWRWFPLIVTGISCAAFVSMYWEGFPAIWLSLGFAVIAYLRPVGWRLLARRLCVIGLVALVTGFTGFMITARSAAKVGGSNAAGRKSPFADNPITSGLSWIFGTARYRGGDVAPPPGELAVKLALLALVVAFVGLAVTALVPRLFPIAFGTLACLVLGWWWWGVASYNGYTHRRFIEFSAVLVFAVVVIGWAALPGVAARRAAGAAANDNAVAPTEFSGAAIEMDNAVDDSAILDDRPSKSPLRSSVVVALSSVVIAVGLVVALVNMRTTLDYRSARGAANNYERTADMLASHPGPLLVAAPNLLDQAWVGLAVANRPGTQFLVPCKCLIGVSDEPYLDGTRPEWVLIQNGVGTVTGDVEQVGESDKLVLYKVGSGRVVVESPNLQGEIKRVAYPAEASASGNG